MSTPSRLDVAALQLAASRGDPVERFIASIADEHLRGVCRETVKLHALMTQNIATTLTGGSDEAMRAAHWLAVNVVEIVHRWGTLREAAARFAMIDAEAIRVTIGGASPK